MTVTLISSRADIGLVRFAWRESKLRQYAALILLVRSRIGSILGELVKFSV